MNVYKGLSEIPHWKNPVVALGTFDGVHRGHRRVIRTVLKIAREIRGQSVVITFDHIPREILKKSGIRVLLTSIQEKTELLWDLGVENIIILSFSHAFSRIKPEVFIRNALVNKIKAHTLVVGKDYQFGIERSGSVELLKVLAEKFNFHLKIVPRLSSGEKKISSTRIREELAYNRLHHVRQLLGHPFFIRGKVIKGHRFATSVGFPTANIKPDERLLLPQGVYAVRVRIAGKMYRGVGNIGFRPTVAAKEEQDIVVEVHIFGFKGELYGQEISVELVQKLRSERRFQSKTELVQQIVRDVIQAKRIFHVS